MRLGGRQAIEIALAGPRPVVRLRGQRDYTHGDGCLALLCPAVQPNRQVIEITPAGPRPDVRLRGQRDHTHGGRCPASPCNSDFNRAPTQSAHNSYNSYSTLPVDKVISRDAEYVLYLK